MPKNPTPKSNTTKSQKKSNERRLNVIKSTVYIYFSGNKCYESVGYAKQTNNQSLSGASVKFNFNLVKNVEMC